MLKNSGRHFQKNTIRHILKKVKLYFYKGLLKWTMKDDNKFWKTLEKYY